MLLLIRYFCPMWALYISIFWWVLGKIPVKYKFNAKDSKLVAENFRKKRQN